MDRVWSGSILISDNSTLEGRSCPLTQQQALTRTDIILSSPSSQTHISLPDGASLRFLSVVDTSLIPLYLALGGPYSVSTINVDAERWFSNILFDHGTKNGGSSSSKWWEVARPDSPFGILAAVETTDAEEQSSQPRVTEVLFYASQNSSQYFRPVTPPLSSPHPGASDDSTECEQSLSLNALALSSDLLHRAQETELTPPASPRGDTEAVFLARPFLAEAEVINEPPVRKRKTANDVFDEASERRKKTRRKDGEGVAATAAPKSDSQIPPLKHQRSASIGQVVPLQTRPLSRSPSIASSRPPTAVARQFSALSRVQSAPGQPEGPTLENQNKDFISRIVMAGMRLYGLAQSKKRRSRASSTARSPIMDVSFEELEADRKNDEDFKLVYHQVFKGTCFSFRASIDRESLQPFAEQVQEVVDQLLAIFCTDPLTQGFHGVAEKLTPGGRKAFATGVTEEHNGSFFKIGKEA